MKSFWIFILIGFLYNSSLQVTAQHNTPSSRVENQRFFDITTAITNILNQLIITVSNTLNVFLNNASSSIISGINKIEDSVRQAITDFTNQIDESREEFENLITSEIAHCFDTLDIAFLTTKNDTIDGIFGCYNNAKNILISVSEDVTEYGQNNTIMIVNARNSLENCINESDFGEKIKCVVDLTNVVKYTFIGLSDNIVNTAEAIKNKIYSSINGSLVCIDQKLIDGQVKLEQTLEEVRECLQNADKYSTTTTNEGDSTTATTNEENSTTATTNEEDSTTATTNEENSTTATTNEENSTTATTNEEESTTAINEENSINDDTNSNNE